MTKRGLETAQEHGRHLPSFSNLAEAERQLFARRDQDLAALRVASLQSSSFTCDFTPESLKHLEKWYFALDEGHGFDVIGVRRTDFERCVSAYLGEVLIRHQPPFEWFVEEFVFTPGKYGIGVRRPLFAVMLTMPSNLASRPNNKRRQSLWRDYRKFAP